MMPRSSVKEGHMTLYSVENVPSANLTQSKVTSAAELKARLLQSARKTAQPVLYQAPTWQAMSESRPKAATTSFPMTPRTQNQVEGLIQSYTRRAIEALEVVVGDLVNEGKTDDARKRLDELRKGSPDVVQYAKFWEMVLSVEKNDVARSAQTLTLALEYVTERESEKEALFNVIKEFLRNVAGGESNSLEVFFNPTGRRLSFHLPEANRSPQRINDGFIVESEEPIAAASAPSVARVQSRTVTKPNTALKPAVRFAESPSQPFSLSSLMAVLPSVTPIPKRREEDMELEDEDQTPKRVFKATPFPSRRSHSGFYEENSISAILSNTPMRVPQQFHEENETPEARPTPKLESRSPARARLYAQSAEKTQRGSVIVLSPVKEGRQSTSNTPRRLVATPVRRSMRNSEAVSAEKKNQLTLEKCDFTYAPNGALIDLSTAESPIQKEQLESVRRSARKSKQVEKLSPKFNTKAY